MSPEAATSFSVKKCSLVNLELGHGERLYFRYKERSRKNSINQRVEAEGEEKKRAG